MAFDQKLVEKGRKVSLKGLLDQAAYHHTIKGQHLSDLLRAGWTRENDVQFAETRTFLESSVAAAVEARTQSRNNRAEEEACIDEAKSCKRKLTQAFILLHEAGIVTDAERQVVERSGTLGRSTPVILEYLTRIHDTVARFDNDLRPYFGGESALAMLERTRTALDRAQGKQEASLASLPEETLRVYEAKGRLLSLIERLNRIARIAFDGQAHIIAKFNKDLILRSRKARSKSTVEPITDVPEGSEQKAC